ncbi:MAG: hypothetical protein AAB434_09985 [Planctomycetota bacterium]
MSTLGKVFTVLVLILSLVYLGITATLFAYRTDYKKALADEKQAHKDEVASKDKDIQARDSEIKLKETQNGAILEAMNKAFTAQAEAEKSSKDWQEKYGSLEKELSTLRAALQSIEGKISEKDQVIAQLTTQLDEANKVKTEAVTAKDAAETKLLDTQSRLSSAEKNLVDLEKQYIQKVKELEESKGKLSMVPPDAIPAEARGVKAVDGKVLAVSKVMNLLIVNVGKERGVEVGDQFTVYRGDKFVGKIQVEKADKDWSSARMIEDFKRLDPTVGDDVTSKAN